MSPRTPESGNLPAECRLRDFLRVLAGIELCALIAIFLPRDLMAEILREIGLGEWPSHPLMGYLARANAALYVLHGGLLWSMSTNVRRFRPLIQFLGWAEWGYAGLLLGIDLQEQLPWWWTASEVGVVGSAATLLLWLVRQLPQEVPLRTREGG